MNIKKWFLLMLLIVVPTADHCFAAEMSQKPKLGFKDWREILQEYGEKFSVYFTIEADQIDLEKGQMPPLSSRFIKLQGEFKDLKEFLNAVKDWVPEADVSVDEATPNIIHVVEKSLKKRSPFLLNQTMSMKFSGPVKDLIQKVVEEAKGGLGEQRGFSLSELAYDSNTKTDVDVKNVTIRSLLCQAIPPCGNRILWSATSVTQNGSVKTLLKLNGPPNSAKVEK